MLSLAAGYEFSYGTKVKASVAVVIVMLSVAIAFKTTYPKLYNQYIAKLSQSLSSGYEVKNVHFSFRMNKVII